MVISASRTPWDSPCRTFAGPLASHIASGGRRPFVGLDLRLDARFHCLFVAPPRIFDILGITVSGAFLCIPAAVLALVSVILDTPGYLAIALIVFPKIYRYSRNLLAKAYVLPHITAARARGLGEGRILLWHVLPVAGPQMIALAGITVSLALGASIPVESLCGLPGIGQLAWQAALSRDLPLLVNLTVLVTLVTLLANSSADVMVYVLRPSQGHRSRLE